MKKVYMTAWRDRNKRN